MSDDDKVVTPDVGRIAGAPLDMFVKGGTTSSAWDEEQKRLAAQSDYLRQHQDQQFQAIEDAGEQGGALAGMLSFQLDQPGSPKVIIEYCYRDSALNRECIAQIARVAHPSDPSQPDLALIVVCPYCLHRTGRQDQSQILIRKSVREFFIRPSTDPDFPEQKKHWINPVDGTFHHVAGTVTTKDAIRCQALGCTFRFRIDDSKLREV